MIRTRTRLMTSQPLLPGRAHSAAIRWRSASAARRGVTLLEVLVSMFILLFGLVGVASLFPVGKYHVTQALQYDQAAALGQRAFEEIRVRGYLRPEHWALSDGSLFSALGSPERLKPVLFDPIGVAQGFAWAPAGTSNTLRRVTWRPTPGNSGIMSAQTAAFIFGSREDLSLELPARRTLPAIQRIDAAARQFAGAYSWAFTAVPAPGQTPAADKAVDTYLVSVVVFRNRTVAAVADGGTEWSPATGLAPNDSYGLGRLRLTGVGTNARLQINRLRMGEWILLRLSDTMARWYKIVSLAPHADAGAIDVEVLGPPFTSSTSMTATIFGSAVAVYEQTMRVESDSDWNPDALVQ